MIDQMKIIQEIRKQQLLQKAKEKAQKEAIAKIYAMKGKKIIT